MKLKHHFDLVIFDWAGTMVDFGCMAPVEALREAFGAEGVVVDAVTVRHDMGRAKSDHIDGLLREPAVVAAWRARFGCDPGADAAARLVARLGPLMRHHAASAATLIPGARETFDQLRRAGIQVASSTGYTRDMMEPVLALAAAQGYQPAQVICAGETLVGRPSPLMIYKACVELGVWPLSRVVKVDDAEAGIREGKAAGAFTVGVTSGNALGLSWEALQALPAAERGRRRGIAARALEDAGADLVIDSVAELVGALEWVG